MRAMFRSLWLIAVLTPALFLHGSATRTHVGQAGQVDESKYQTIIPPLIKALKSKDENGREKAISELVRLGSDAIPALVEFLNHEKGDARVYAAKALITIDPKNKLAHSALSEMVSKSTGKVLLEAAEILATIDPENDAAIPALVKLAAKTIIFPTEKNMTLQRGAALTLAMTGPGIRALTQLLKHWDSWVRRAAAFAFDERTETLENASPSILSAVKAALPTLIEALTDKDETVRGIAGEALAQIGAEAIPSLTEAAKSSDKRLSSAAAEVLEQIRKRKN